MNDNQRDVSSGDAGGRDMSRYSATVADAVNLFDEAGVPRSDRTIQRYCKRGHLDCYIIDREQDTAYLINPESIERRIEELRQLAEMNMTPGVATQRATARHDASGRDTARHGAAGERSNEPKGEGEHPDLKDRIKQLEEDKRKLADAMSLKDVEIRVKDKLLVDLNEQRRKDVELIANLGESVGEWKTKYLQLSAPKDADEGRDLSDLRGETVRDAEIESSDESAEKTNENPPDDAEQS